MRCNAVSRCTPHQSPTVTASPQGEALKGGNMMDFYKVPIGFGLALSANAAAMNRYAHLSESQKQDILNRAHNVRSEKEMYTLVANLANGTMQ